MKRLRSSDKKRMNLLRSEFLITALLLLVALFVRVIFLNQSFWLDEAAQALESVRPWHQQLMIKEDFQPPLYHVWLHIFTYVSHAEWWLRMASLIPGLVTVLLTIILGKKILSPAQAHLAGLLLALSQIHVFYSQELRPYSFAAMWGTLSMLAFYNWLFGKKHAWSWWYVVATVFGMLSVYTYGFLILTQLIIVIMYQRQQIFAFMNKLLIAGLLCLPWLPFFIEQLQVGQTLQSNLPGWDQVVSIPFIKALPLTFAKLILGRIYFGVEPVTILLIALIGGGSLWLVYEARKTKYLRLFGMWLIIPVILAWFVSLAIPVIEPKRLLFVLPAWFLLLASGYRSHIWHKMALGMLISGQLLALVGYWAYPQNQRENWRDAVALIESIAEEESGVVFSFNAPFAPFVWYQSRDLKTYTLPSNTPVTLHSVNRSFISVLLHDQIFVFEYLMDLTDPQRHIVSWLRSQDFQKAHTFQYPVLGEISVWIK